MWEKLMGVLVAIAILGAALAIAIQISDAADCTAKGGVYMQTFGGMECLDVKTIK